MISARISSVMRRMLPASMCWQVLPPRLYWASRDPVGNFGDQLAPLIVEGIFGFKVKYSGLGAADLIAVGSLLEGVEALGSSLRPHVWGAGYIREGGRWNSMVRPRFHAVRGRLSLERVRHLSSKSIAVGDPALLLPFVYNPPVVGGRRFEMSIVPHFVDRYADDIRWARRHGLHVIDVLAPPHRVIDEIRASNFVLASSLHALIVADAYGVPNQWTPVFSSSVEGGRYKFDDYYSAFGIPASPLLVQDAVDGVRQLRKAWRAPVNLREVQSGLISSFPGRCALVS